MPIAMQELVDQIQSEKTVLILGAGASVPSNAPSVAALIEEISSEFGIDADSLFPDDVAQGGGEYLERDLGNGVSHLDTPSFGGFACASRFEAPSAAYHQLDIETCQVLTSFMVGAEQKDSLFAQVEGVLEHLTWMHGSAA